MRVLFLTSRLPYPPDRGDRLRTNQFLQQFSREHAVTLVSFVADHEQQRSASKLAPFCEEMHLITHSLLNSVASVAFNFWRDQPLQTLYYRSRRMSRLIDELVGTRQFDMAYVHLFRMAPYLGKHTNLYRVLDLTDLISMELQAALPYENLIWRMLYHFELPRIRRFEQIVAGRSEEVWFIGDRDCEAYVAQSGAAQLRVIPNTVDEALFDVEAQMLDRPVLLFVGNLDVKHNVDAIGYLIQSIMPKIWSECADCLLRIVGAGDRRVVNGLAQHPRVQIVGYVEDLGGAFGASTLAVAPVRFAAGVQNKVLEAMAAGLPVVTSSLVAEGLGATPEREILTGDDAETFARQVGRLLRSPSYRKQLGSAGRIFAEANFRADFAAARLREIDEKIHGNSA